VNGDISMGGDGIISDGMIDGNITYESGFGGGSAINMDGVTDTVVRNNVLYDNHATGISLYQIDGGTGSRDNRVLNNSIIVAADGRWAIKMHQASLGALTPVTPATSFKTISSSTITVGEEAF